MIQIRYVWDGKKIMTQIVIETESSIGRGSQFVAELKLLWASHELKLRVIDCEDANWPRDLCICLNVEE